MGGGRITKWGLAIATLVALAIFLAIGRSYFGHRHDVAPPAPSPPPLIPQRHPDVWPHTIFGAAPGAGSSNTDPPKELDVCGKGKVPNEGADWTNINEYILAATRESFDRWRATLLDSSDNRALAVGLMIQRTHFPGDDSTLRTEESRDDELIQLAARAGDPAIYGLAVTLCLRVLSDSNPQGACQRISLSEWTRIDPDNAQPWIATAQAAHNRGDIPAEAAAFARAAATHEIRNSNEWLLAAGSAAIPKDTTPLERAAMALFLDGYGGLSQPLQEIGRYCSADAVKLEEIHKQCDAVAELLVNQGGTVLNDSYGGRIGERLGWPVERTRQIARERAALQALELVDAHDPWSCQSISRLNAYMEKRMQLGEIGMLRELLESSNRPGQPLSQ